MALPNPGMDAVPFTPLTAEFLDDMIENIESLSDGTGFETGAITTNTLAESAVKESKIDFSTFTFSTSEKVVGKWTDGSLIYRKSFSGTTTLPGAHGISNLLDVLGLDAMVRTTSDGAWRMIPWLFNTTGSSDWYAGVSVGTTNFSWQMGAQIGSFTKSRVTIYYTKSA